MFPKEKLSKKKDNFTIISNNCWGGKIYNSYGMSYMSPTIGMVIYPKDFFLFMRKFNEYIKEQLVFIEPKESKWLNSYQKCNVTYPIVKLNDIELHFLHYKSREEAKEKWTRRCERINKDCFFLI